MKFSDTFLGADDIPSLFGYLSKNGYQIQGDLTNMLFRSAVQLGGVSEQRLSGNRKLICFATFCQRVCPLFFSILQKVWAAAKHLGAAVSYFTIFFLALGGEL